MFIKRKLHYLALLSVFVQLFFLFICLTLSAQEIIPNKYGLRVINTVADYRQTVAKDSARQLINLSKAIPNIEFDLHYSTKNNFIHKKLYRHAGTTYLRLQTANALTAVQKEFN